VTGKGKEPQVPPLRFPGFPVEISGVDQGHAVSFKGNRTRGRGECREVGIRVRSGRDDKGSAATFRKFSDLDGRSHEQLLCEDRFERRNHKSVHRLC
jgi:hypothetical protein